MEEQMRQNHIPLFSPGVLRSSFPILILSEFTLQYEMSFTNILNMLNVRRESP